MATNSASGGPVPAGVDPGIEEGRKLIEAFLRIRDPKVRAWLVAITAALKDDDEG